MTSEKEDESKEDPAVDTPLATLGEVFSFAATTKTRLNLVAGVFWAVVAGLALPASLLYFARIMSDISVVAQEGIDAVIEIVYAMMVLGVVSLFSESFMYGCFETAANDMTARLKQQWFAAVVRQDMAYFDLQNVAGTATIISTNAAKFKKGVSKKLGTGVQYTCTVLAGFGLAFYGECPHPSYRRVSVSFSPSWVPG
jgi:ATP-binding cassette subfamily B (MDR/TAP) protein 1